MFLATIICSDPGCDEEHEVAVERLDQLEGFACECGYGFVLAAVAELRESGGELIALAPAGEPAARRAA
ncbi:MAG: hypothetical protein ACRDKH_04710 [Solirubrobacterales bacterium]